MSELLTVDETAAQLRLHPMTVRRHIKQGHLRAVRAGGRIRVRREDLERFLQPAGPKLRITLPPEEPITEEELARRAALYEATMRLRAEIGPIGIAAAELIRQARAEEEASYER
jgi:excisionase family DNA binding protein